MSAKAIREVTAKEILNRHLGSKGAPDNVAKCRFVAVDEKVRLSDLANENPWLSNSKLVVKPDQLIKRRGKLGLIAVNKDLPEVKKWVEDRMGKDQKVGNAVGKLRNFIIEPFIPHKPDEEAYVCIYSERDKDVILFTHEGGVDIGDVDAKAMRLDVPVNTENSVTVDLITKKLLTQIPATKKQVIAQFITALYKLYVDLYFTYLEINPLVVTDKNIYILDLAAKLDATADYLCRPMWGEIDYPPPFGRDALPEEAYIADLDAKSGASLKLTILNRNGRIWTMVAGGGASVIYSDTICDLGGTSELANYGEYSGAPSEQQTYEYAKTVLTLMTSSAKHPQGKVLITGGGIANFTNVAATFRGIIRALQEFRERLIEHNVSIFVRRAGPNYQEGLRRMREVGGLLGLPVHVFGPETHMTAICAMALGKRPITQPASGEQGSVPATTATFLLPAGQTTPAPSTPPKSSSPIKAATPPKSVAKPMFSADTKAIVWGMQTRAVQSMLDFDFVCRRSEPSVVAMVYPFTGDHKQKFYWGHKEILIPVYKKMEHAMTKHR